VSMRSVRDSLAVQTASAEAALRVPGHGLARPVVGLQELRRAPRAAARGRRATPYHPSAVPDGPDADLRRAASAAGPGRVRGPLQRAATASRPPAPPAPARPFHRRPLPEPDQASAPPRRPDQRVRAGRIEAQVKTVAEFWHLTRAALVIKLAACDGCMWPPGAGVADGGVVTGSPNAVVPCVIGTLASCLARGLRQRGSHGEVAPGSLGVRAGREASWADGLQECPAAGPRAGLGAARTSRRPGGLVPLPGAGGALPRASICGR